MHNERVPEWSDVNASMAIYHRRSSQTDRDSVSPSELLERFSLHRALGAVRSPGESLIAVRAGQASPSTTRTVVHCVTADMPFLVDSLLTALSARALTVYRLIHPILFVKRDEQGRALRASLDAFEGATAESWIEFDITSVMTADELQELETALQDLYVSIARVTSDWPAMRNQVTDVVSGNAEFEALGRWLNDDRFTFLATAVSDSSCENWSQLAGLFAIPSQAKDLSADAAVIVAAHAGKNLITATSAVRATIHRPVYMSYFGFRRNDEVVHVVGLLTRDAYTDSVLDVPVVAEIARNVLAAEGSLPGSHSYRDVVQLLETYPREELFHTSSDWLQTMAVDVSLGQYRLTPYVYGFVDHTERFVNIFALMPRDGYSTDVRIALENELSKVLPVADCETSVSLSEMSHARIHFRLLLQKNSHVTNETLDSVCEKLKEFGRSWYDDLVTAVAEIAPADFDVAQEMIAWRRSFEDAYVSQTSTAVAARDIVQLSCAQDDLEVRCEYVSERLWELRVFTKNRVLKLSHLLPILAALGVDVEDEIVHAFQQPDSTTWYAHAVTFSTTSTWLADGPQLLSDVVRACLRGELGIDSLLELAPTLGVAVRDIAMLRTVARYVSQWTPYTFTDVVAALVSNQSATAEILAVARMILTTTTQPDVTAALAAIDAVASFDHDTVLRAVLGAISACVRTNAYVAELGSAAVAMKFAATAIEQMPHPRPFAEIFVESPRIHGVHLRFGPVARGGLRWSDRPEDLRTEILGLVRAQVVKNAVIVPTGSKGGFAIKQPVSPADRSVWMDQGIRSYQEFISALISVTDNVVQGVLVHPAGITVRDTDDPYLVVAADKGTASFSDIANAIALEKGFWLGDAFASGGSVGYDHKAMGITARGAWESVKHHAAMQGLDVQNDEFTIVGIGDMSGDVFGNGLLLSKTAKLVAAFDHRHIFLDPNPDAATSWIERKRLFDLPRSSWADYSADLISAGGGVFARTEKHVTVSAEAMSVLTGNAESATMTPTELLRIILRAPVDVLWNGGIGTYVKASHQTHAQVGDKANDALRIDAQELRCRIVGEGGNLGFTQAARVEAFRKGVAINTDAIDNSAGVDTSDHEVNLKILFTLRNSLEMEERNRLLGSMTDDVAALVLADNIAQNLALAVGESHAPRMLTVHERLMQSFENAGFLRRDLEVLPSDADVEILKSQGQGLTRPELSVLMAYVKIHAQRELEASTVVDEPWTREFLDAYFPGILRSAWSAEISQHPLRREIVATQLANIAVNECGLSAIYRLTEETECSTPIAIKALMAARKITGLDTLWDRILADDSSWPARLAMALESRRYIDRVARWLIAHRGPEFDFASDVELFSQAVTVIRQRLTTDLRGAERERWERGAEMFIERGASPETALIVSGLLDEFAALDLQLKSQVSDVDLEVWSDVYFAVSDAISGDVLLTSISSLQRDDHWQTLARAALRADMYTVLASVTEQIVVRRSDFTFEQWRARHAATLQRIESMISDMNKKSSADIAVLSVALRLVRELAAQTATSAR